MGSNDQSEGSIQAVGQSDGWVTDPGDGLINFIKSRVCDQVKHWDESDIWHYCLWDIDSDYQILNEWRNPDPVSQYHR